uniref:G domain-containing protein n=1 Tax=Chrysotila carterae TaxID=13221 RepID=A0A7S4BDZ9_CHRCT
MLRLNSHTHAHRRVHLAKACVQWLQRSSSTAHPRREHTILPPRKNALSVPERFFTAPEESRILRCCLIGPTNAGKSTLLNGLLRSSVSIVSEKIHTTRENMLAYLTEEKYKTQVQFIDAPGALGPHIPAIRRAIWDAVRRANLALIVVDANDKHSARQCEQFLLQLEAVLVDQEKETGRRTQTVLVLNKVDLVKPKAKLLNMSEAFHKAFRFDWPCLMVSARDGSGVDTLRDWLLLMSKPGKWSVAPDVVHERPPVEIAAEIIRAEIFNSYREELPYIIKQRTIGWTELRNGDLRIDQQLLLPDSKRANAHRIVTKRLPGVCIAARPKLAEAFGRPVHLFLTVGKISQQEERDGNMKHV